MEDISSPLKLWRNLCSKAGLEIRLKGGKSGRDSDVEEALKLAFAVPETVVSLEEWLIVDAASSFPTVTTELLLIEVIKTQAWFAQMMQDILNVLIIAEAKQAVGQLSVEFKFDNVIDPIKATFEEFRKIVACIQRVMKKKPTLPNVNLMWNLAKSLGSDHTKLLFFPKDFPPLPTLTLTGCNEVDALLKYLPELVSDFRELWRHHGATRSQVYNAAKAMLASNPDEQVLYDQLCSATDYWDIKTILAAQEISRQVVSKELSPETAVAKLHQAFSGIEWREIWVEHTIKELLDVVQLPVWRRRHELYSVWVGTRMLAVVNDVVSDMQFYPVNGVLSFEFGGNRLATFDWNNKQFEVWAEKRSELVGPSPKRKKGIQPDFRVLQLDSEKTKSNITTYVLECKHYLKSNASNFTQAATDYARSCPAATVHIVNHGPANEQTLISAVPAELQDRVRFIGNATPLHDAATQGVSNVIRNALFPNLHLSSSGTSATKIVDKPAQIAPSGTVGYVQLEWDDSLVDMDLSLQAIAPDGQILSLIDYRNKGSLNTVPFAKLNGDEQRGPGKERIDISIWSFSRYEIFATNYSKSGQMTPQALHCDIVTEHASERLLCPAGLEETCYKWKISEIIIDNGVPIVVPAI